MENKKPLSVLFLTTFLDLMGFGLIIPILPTLSQSLGASDTEIGMIAAIYALMNFGFSSLWGTLSDRHGRRPIILVSIVMTSIAYLFFAQAEILWILILSRVFSGIGSANIGAAQAYIGDVTTPANRAKSMGLIGAAFGLGFIAGPPIGGFIIDQFNLEVLGYLAALLSWLNLIFAYFYLPESIKVKNAAAPFNFNVVKAIREQLAKPLIRELFTINFIFITAFSMMQVTAVLLWSEHSFLDASEIGFVFMFIGVSSAIVQATLIGVFKKRFGENRMLIIGLVLMIIGLFGMPFFQEGLFIPFELLTLVLISLANGFVSPALLSLITQATPIHGIGKITGLNQSFGSVGRIVGPILGGALYEIEYHLPYIGGPILLIAAVWMAFEFNKKMKKEPLLVEDRSV